MNDGCRRALRPHDGDLPFAVVLRRISLDADPARTIGPCSHEAAQLADRRPEALAGDAGAIVARCSRRQLGQRVAGLGQFDQPQQPVNVAFLGRQIAGLDAVHHVAEPREALARFLGQNVVGLTIGQHGMLVEVVVGEQIERHFPRREHHAVEAFVDDGVVEAGRQFARQGVVEGAVDGHADQRRGVRSVIA